MKKILLLLLLFGVTMALAQDEETQSENARRITGENLNNIDARLLHTFNDTYEGLQGHPYYINAWLDGGVTMKAGGERRGLRLKYDVYHDQIVVLKNQEAYTFDANAISAFTLEDLSFSRLRQYRNGFYFPDLKITPDQFFEILHDGEYKLIYKYSKKLLKANFDTGLQTGSRYDQFQEDHKFYLILPSGEALRLKRNKKAVLKALNSKKHQKKLEGFIAKKNLDLKKAEDLATLIAYFDTLD